MERRTFVQASLASAYALTTGAATADEKAKTTELYEWRIYTLKPAKQAMLDAYLKEAFIPGCKRAGCGPIGVFTEQGTAETVRVHVLVVHPNGVSASGLAAKLAADAEYQKTGKDYLEAKAADPVYTRIESSLLGAIEGMPKLAQPDVSKARLLNLRIYESHNERANAKKIEMFNKGELAIFQRDGLTPVLFGQALVGSALPNLTYLLVFPDDDARKAAWDKFRADPEWIKLKSIPEYADKEIVSKITNVLLTPVKYSEV
jgi:hypothetical protein